MNSSPTAALKDAIFYPKDGTPFFRQDAAGVTIVEVLIAAMMIFIGLGSIFEMNTQSIQLLRATHLTAASTQMLQERVEILRSKPWPEISNSDALATLMQTAVASEKELVAPNLTEILSLSAPQIVNGQIAPNAAVFQVRRKDGVVKILQSGDFGNQSLLLADALLTWGSTQNPQERKLRVILSRTGLTRSGIFGSVFGRPAH